MTEVGAAFQGVDQKGYVFLNLRDNLCGGGLSGSIVWVRDVGDDTAHWEVFWVDYTSR